MGGCDPAEEAKLRVTSVVCMLVVSLLGGGMYGGMILEDMEVRSISSGRCPVHG